MQGGHYQQLFDAYVAEMRIALSEATKWWAFVQAREAAAGPGVRPDRPPIGERWPFGLVSHPFVIDCYRRWSLACQALNDRLEGEDDDDDDDAETDVTEAEWGRDDLPENDTDLAALEAPVEPRELLIDMLPGRADDIATALALFVFDPVGMDKKDRLV